ncbi:hypothetical protein ACVR05_07335 [Streptococcus caprae]|uniref:YolD-like family protein n=1 Tax=Streptococcus caprae TaxID=1640501 RepID=A0ABV8CUY8_9STRE
MVDRSYLPFSSARHYHDPKMQKWMGFFLSEHTTALLNDQNIIESPSNLTVSEKNQLISQLYSAQQLASFTILNERTIKVIIGTISVISQVEIVLKTKDHYERTAVADILDISEECQNSKSDD